MEGSSTTRIRGPRARVSGSAAACPESGLVVSCLIVGALQWEGAPWVRTAAREKKLYGLPVPWNGGVDLLRSRADASLGLASRADPTLHIQEWNSCITGSRSKQIPAGSRELGPCPKSSINRWRAPIIAGRTMRKESAQETRGLGRATAAGTVRWTTQWKGRIPVAGPGERNTERIVSRHSGDP